MTRWITSLCGLVALSITWAGAQIAELRFPEKAIAGTALSIPTTGSGTATCYIVGPGSAIRREFHLGESLALTSNDLHNAGHYAVLLVMNSRTERAQFDVVASPQPSTMSFLAKPSRLPVNISDGISGVAYLFDAFRNLVLQPQPVSFEVLDSNGGSQSRSAASRNGVAWVRMNSAAKAGAAQFQATAGGVREKRVIQQVAGDPCSIRMSARASGQRVRLETELVRDCNGNPVPDGTIVSFTAIYHGGQSTVEVPLKRGIARTEMPAHKGAQISVASGVVMGNEIRWGGGGL